MTHHRGGWSPNKITLHCPVTGCTSLGRQIFQTQEEAKRAGGVFRSLDGRLREANGRFVKGREAVEDWTQAAGRASSGTGILTRSVGGLGGALGALSIAVVAREIGQLGVESVQAAGQMEQLRRATEQIQGAARKITEIFLDLATPSFLFYHVPFLQS